MPELLDIVVHLDRHVAAGAADFGVWTYVLVALVLFLETGVLPFLPGDSLVFATGAVAALPGAEIDPVTMALVLIAAAFAGDACNYAVGRRFGPYLLARRVFFIDRAQLERARFLYAGFGGKALVLARFVPLVRTLAPFAAGMGSMHYGRFALYNVVGAIAWVLTFASLGYGFGNLPVVQAHFQLVVVAIILVTMLPLAVGARSSHGADARTRAGS